MDDFVLASYLIIVKWNRKIITKMVVGSVVRWPSCYAACLLIGTNKPLTFVELYVSWNARAMPFQ